VILLPFWDRLLTMPATEAQAEVLMHPAVQRLLNVDEWDPEAWGWEPAALRLMPRRFRRLYAVGPRHFHQYLSDRRRRRHPRLAAEWLGLLRARVDEVGRLMRLAMDRHRELWLNAQREWALRRLRSGLLYGTRLHLMRLLADRPGMLAELCDDPAFATYRPTLLSWREAEVREPGFMRLMFDALHPLGGEQTKDEITDRVNARLDELPPPLDEHPLVLLCRGNLWSRSEDGLARARWFYMRVVRAWPADIAAWVNVALTYRRQERWALADAWIRNAPAEARRLVIAHGIMECARRRQKVPMAYALRRFYGQPDLGGLVWREAVENGKQKGRR
jgi:hypothetical protein